jgi:hypothetical protein
VKMIRNARAMSAALITAAALSACISTDNGPPGSEHTVFISAQGSDVRYERMDELTMAEATKRCAVEGGEVVVIRRWLPGPQLNTLQLNYRCQR